MSSTRPPAAQTRRSAAEDPESRLRRLLPGIGKAIRHARRELAVASRTGRPVIILGETGTGKSRALEILHGPSIPSGDNFPCIDLSNPAEPARTMAGGLLDEQSVCHVDHLEAAGKERLAWAVRMAGKKDGVGRMLLSVTTNGGGEGGWPALPRELLAMSHCIALPPLRERREDLTLLLESICREKETSPLRLTADDLLHLYGHQWPGNVTELIAWFDSRSGACGGDAPLANGAASTSLGALLDREVDSWVASLLKAGSVTGLLTSVMDRLERSLINSVYSRTDENQVRAARILGINRNTLASKLRKHGFMDPPPKARRTQGRRK